MAIWIQYKCQSGYNTKVKLDTIQKTIWVQCKWQYGYNANSSQDTIQGTIWINTRGNLYAIHMVIHYNTNGSWGITQKWQYGYNINFSS